MRLAAAALATACTVEGPESETASGWTSDPCEAVCRQARECGNSSEPASECEAGCRTTLRDAADMSSMCGAATEELLACVGGLDCHSLYDYVNETSLGYPCALRDERAAEACDAGASSPDGEGVGGSDDGNGEGSSDEGNGDDGGSSSDDECDSDFDCGSHEHCVAGRCDYAQCTSDSHCSGCNRCVNNFCSYCGEGPYGCYC